MHIVRTEFEEPKRRDRENGSVVVKKESLENRMSGIRG